jgi:hypothetical protein
MLLFETERKVEERDVEDSGELEKEDNSLFKHLGWLL